MESLEGRIFGCYPAMSDSSSSLWRRTVPLCGTVEDRIRSSTQLIQANYAAYHSSIALQLHVAHEQHIVLDGAIQQLSLSGIVAKKLYVMVEYGSSQFQIWNEIWNSNQIS